MAHLEQLHMVPQSLDEVMVIVLPSELKTPVCMLMILRSSLLKCINVLKTLLGIKQDKQHANRKREQ